MTITGAIAACTMPRMTAHLARFSPFFIPLDSRISFLPSVPKTMPPIEKTRQAQKQGIAPMMLRTRPTMAMTEFFAGCAPP